MGGALAFFGAFNPPTRAHLGLAELALSATGRERVIFIPSKAAYIRDTQGKDFAYTDAQRLGMLRAAAASRPWMRVEDWELREERQPRSYDTLCHLRSRGETAALLMGSDKLPELEHGWLHVPEIAREFGIVCLARGGDDPEAIFKGDAYLAALRPYIRWVVTPEGTKDVSSTAVRRRVARIRALRAELDTLVPEEILPLL